jgi:galactose-1-phosphate transferase
MQETKEIVVGNQKSVEKITLQRIHFVSYSFLKRILDIILSLIALVFVIPICLIIKAVTLHYEDYDSIFYTQERIGKNGKKFKIIKFRSMVVNADEELAKMLKKEEHRNKWDEDQKIDNDPRITKVGKVLRRTSLDELPQFINVLKGDMSIIGPRPLVPGELSKHHGNYEIYESVKPGITGWWGCHGRSYTTYKARLELEYYYVKHFGLITDIKCFFLTIFSVICKKGAK